MKDKLMNLQKACIQIISLHGIEELQEKTNNISGTG